VFDAFPRNLCAGLPDGIFSNRKDSNLGKFGRALKSNIVALF
jgi:hypothetical protein